MRTNKALIILDGDETLWSFKWHELIWASELTPPLRRARKNELIDSKGVILFLKDGTRTFLEIATRKNFLLSMASHNDWKPNVKSILELLELKNYFYHPQVDWRSKDQQIASILEKMEKNGINIPTENVFFLDDRPNNLEIAQRAFPKLHCLLITKETRLYPDAWNQILSILNHL